MTATTPNASRKRESTGLGVVCLLAGAGFGLLSVFSNSRATCALWVLVALACTFVAGLLLRPSRSMGHSKGASRRQ